ncbi:hypothetical protein [Actinocorallia sp. A-T 12471]|uniref:hypothetical protein n=1 Tax=Actinocorallia sp. A-T 12471 TaxID=3089813 RepID=UPI0029CDD4CC|nr:hypothetical protein [Actinocorallia sp. A-T 12471]MDX6741956.1 hypothetical protein [Actinocorallia sp. A-T 12471]
MTVPARRPAPAAREENRMTALPDAVAATAQNAEHAQNEEPRMPAAVNAAQTSAPTADQQEETLMRASLPVTAVFPVSAADASQTPAKPARRSGKKAALKRTDRRAAAMAQRSRGNARTLPTRRMNNRAGR